MGSANLKVNNRPSYEDGKFRDPAIEKLQTRPTKKAVMTTINKAAKERETTRTKS